MIDLSFSVIHARRLVWLCPSIVNECVCCPSGSKFRKGTFRPLSCGAGSMLIALRALCNIVRSRAKASTYNSSALHMLGWLRGALPQTFPASTPSPFRAAVSTQTCTGNSVLTCKDIIGIFLGPARECHLGENVMSRPTLGVYIKPVIGVSGT